MITQKIKFEIADILVNKFIPKHGSQAKAAAQIPTSDQTLISIKRGGDEWNKISDDLWRKVGKQIGWKPEKKKWNSIQTLNTKQLHSFFTEAKNDSEVRAIVNPAGTGKTHAAREFAANPDNKHVYHIECDDSMNRKDFLQAILFKMGEERNGRITDLMDRIIKRVLLQENPLIIIDEADKLDDRTLYFFISFYNKLEDKCGIVLLSTSFLKKRIEDGLKYQRKGFEEINSRLNQNFVHLNKIKQSEVEKLCKANGLEDEAQIHNIINDSKGDLRVVKDKVRAQIKENEKQLVSA